MSDTNKIIANFCSKWSELVCPKCKVLERALELACEDTASRENDLPDRVRQWYIQKAELEVKQDG